MRIGPIHRGEMKPILAVLICCSALWAQEKTIKRYLYVASPGIRDYLLPSGGHGVLVFDVENDYKFVKAIPTRGYASGTVPDNIKGFMASAVTNRMYIATLKKLECIDLVTEKSLWEINCTGGCDRGALSPDGKIIVQAPLYQDYWVIYDAITGKEIRKVSAGNGFRSHNTIFNQNGKEAYLAGIGSKHLAVLDVEKMEVVKKVGPFTEVIRPFTMNGKGTLAFVNVNHLIGFEVGDVTTGKMLHRVDVTKEGFKPYPRGSDLARHKPSPSHGIAMTADETEIWVVDGVNDHLHIYDVTVMPPKYKQSIATKVFPGWVTMGLDGMVAYPSSGEVIDVKTKKTIANLIRPMDNELKKLLGTNSNAPLEVEGEKMLEIDFIGSEPVRAGDQFGVGRVVDGKVIREGCMEKNKVNYDPLANKVCDECCGSESVGIRGLAGPLFHGEPGDGMLRLFDLLGKEKPLYHPGNVYHFPTR